MERNADGRIRTTEWEDIQYRYGNKVGKYKTHELEVLAQKISDMNEDSHLPTYNPQKEKLQAKLAEKSCEDDQAHSAGASSIHTSDDDDEVLAEIRRRRIAELKKQFDVECFGTLRHISGTDYIAEITESSQRNWVVAALIKPGLSNCESLLNVLRTVAQKNRDVKFVSIVSTEAIPNFPDKHLPCILLYMGKSLKNQITGLEVWLHKGQLSVQSVERVLQGYGVLKGEVSE